MINCLLDTAMERPSAPSPASRHYNLQVCINCNCSAQCQLQSFSWIAWEIYDPPLPMPKESHFYPAKTASTASEQIGKVYARDNSSPKST
jgi:hypothetical protein